MATREPHFGQKMRKLGSSDDWNLVRLVFRRTRWTLFNLGYQAKNRRRKTDYGPKCAKKQWNYSEWNINKASKKTITIATIVSKSVNHRATWESTKEDSKSSGLDATRSTVAIEHLERLLITIANYFEVILLQDHQKYHTHSAVAIEYLAGLTSKLN